MTPLRALPLAALLPLFAAGCPPGGETAALCTPSGQGSLVFADASASANLDEAARRSFAERASRFAAEGIACEGDVVAGHLLYAYTGEAYGFRDVVATKAPDLAGQAEVDHAGIRGRWEQAMGREREALAEATAAFATRPPTLSGPERMHTDLHKSLRVITEAFNDLPAESRRRVLYLSDMHESMAGPGRRDFDARPPASVEQARAWAVEDLARLEAEGFARQGALRGVTVEVHRSTLAHSAGADAVRAYWETVFEALGARVRFT